MGKLTAKQEQFAQEWFKTGNKTEAYRRAYDAGKCSEATIARKAHDLSNQGKIRARFEELQKEAAQANLTDVGKIDKMLKTAYKAAYDNGKPAAMVSAAMGLVKLYGLDAETQRRLESMGSANDDDTADIEEYFKRFAETLPN